MENEHWERFRQELLQQVAEDEDFIADAETGLHSFKTRKPDGEWYDAIPSMIEQAKRSVAVLRSVIAKIEQDHLGVS